jgi:phosphoglycerate dehydrogenase-like enzyme
VIAHDIRTYDEFYRANAVTPIDLPTLLAEADFVSLHVPLDASTRGMIGEREIAAMKPTAYLINTARGGIVDEAALKAALVAERLAGAAFDVFSSEPPADNDLLQLPSFLGTPHIGASTREAVMAMGRAAIAGLDGAEDSIDLTA